MKRLVLLVLLSTTACAPSTEVDPNAAPVVLVVESHRSLLGEACGFDFSYRAVNRSYSGFKHPLDGSRQVIPLNLERGEAFVLSAQGNCESGGGLEAWAYADGQLVDNAVANQPYGVVQVSGVY